MCKHLVVYGLTLTKKKKFDRHLSFPISTVNLRYYRQFGKQIFLIVFHWQLTAAVEQSRVVNSFNLITLTKFLKITFYCVAAIFGVVKQGAKHSLSYENESWMTRIRVIRRVRGVSKWVISGRIMFRLTMGRNRSVKASRGVDERIDGRRIN